MNRNRILLLLCILLIALALLACACNEAECRGICDQTEDDPGQVFAPIATRSAELPTVRALMTQEAAP